MPTRGGSRLLAIALAGGLLSAIGPLEEVRPDGETIRVGAQVAVVVLLFCLGLDFGPGDRRAAAATLAPGPLLAADITLNFLPGVAFGVLAGFGLTGAVLLGGVTWASSCGTAVGSLDEGGRLGNRETPAVLAVLVVEHAATAAYLPLAAAILIPGTDGRAAAGVAAAAVAYLSGAALAPAGPAAARRAVGVVRTASAALAALTLGLLVPGARLPGAITGGTVLAALAGATKIVTGCWAARRLPQPPGTARIRRAGRLRAGFALLPRGELAVAIGLLAALSGPGRGPGTALSALAAVVVVATGLAPRALALRHPLSSAGAAEPSDTAVSAGTAAAGNWPSR